MTIDPTPAGSPPTPPADRGFDDPSYDAGTFTALREPRGAARLDIGEGRWHQISRHYVTVQLIASGITALIAVGAGLAASLLLGLPFIWIPVGIFLVVVVVGAAFVPRQARSIGWMLRSDDLVFRRGILWQRLVAVPYGRMQLVDISHGPLDRGFGIAQLKLVTAAASTGVTIPGLSQEAAEHLRDTLVEVAETRRTGL